MKREQVSTLVYVVMAALREAAKEDKLLKGVPNGHLYALMLPEYPDLDLTFWMGLLSMLKEKKMLKESNYLLTITPEGEDFFQKMEAIVTAGQPKEKNSQK